MLCPRCGSEAPDVSDRCENCGLALVETKASVGRKGPYQPGDVVLERYEIRERIAAEPLYWSYIAHDLDSEVPVLVRAVRRTILPGRLDHQSFARRLEPLFTLDLGGVSQLRRIERDGGNTLVVSELVDGLPLRSLIDLRRQDGRAFSALETLAVLTLVAEALEAAIPVIHHGDLRPTHVLVGDEGLDLEALGIAAALPWEETVRALKDSPEVCGYLAPEVLEGRQADSRSDIYSLAIIACELLTGRVPPSEPSLLDDFLAHLPPMTDDVLRRSLSPDMARRDATPMELVKALAAVLGVEPPCGPRSGPSTPSQGVLHDPTIEIARDEDGTLPFAPSHVIRRATEPAEVPRDPSVPAEPDREGTQQISDDMLEPVEEDDTDAGEVDRAPAASTEPAPDETRDVTQDALRPLAGFGSEPLQVSLLSTPGSTPREPDVESIRSLGLDPKLVRAARRLDRERVGLDDESPTIRKKVDGTRRGENDGAAAAAGVYVVPRPVDLMPPSEEPAGPAPEDPGETADDEVEAPVVVATRPAPALDPDATIPRPVVPAPARPLGTGHAPIPTERSGSPGMEELPSPAAPLHPIPEALLGSTLGPSSSASPVARPFRLYSRLTLTRRWSRKRCRPWSSTRRSPRRSGRPSAPWTSRRTAWSGQRTSRTRPRGALWSVRRRRSGGGSSRSRWPEGCCSPPPACWSCGRS